MGACLAGGTAELEPDFARAYCNRGFARLKKSDYKGALEDLNTGIEKDADMPICYYARGEIHYGGGNYEEAVEDFTRGWRLSPTPKGYESRGKAFEQLGKRDQALSDYQAALKLAPNYKGAQEALQRLTKRQD
jgi:tetratricopeptide (TPR) repeat protein